MADLRVTLIQTPLHWENSAANLAMLEEKIWQIDQATDLIVLPEMFTTGFTMNAAALAEPMNLTTFKWMKAQAAQTGAVVTGSYIVKENNQYFNRLVWMQPDGEYKVYDKRHCFRMAGEHEVYTPGYQRLIVTWKGWRICPLVCYDLRFPVWSRNVRQGNNGHLSYDCLIYVANWPQSRRIAWNTLLQARAIENLSYVVGVNRTGTDAKGIDYSGDSAVITPKGEYLLSLGLADLVQTVVLDREALDHFRAAFPAYLDADQFTLRGEAE